MEIVDRDLLSQRITEGLSSIDLNSDIDDETERKVKVLSTLISLANDIKTQEVKESHDREMERLESEKQDLERDIQESRSDHDEDMRQIERDKQVTEKNAQESKALHDREMEKIERDKLKLGVPKTILEILKIGVPTILPLIVWRLSFKEMVKFEETGRFVSTASKELKLPKIFK